MDNNGDPEHDMYVDYDYQTNTGEAVFDGIDDEIGFDDDYSDEEDEDHWKLDDAMRFGCFRCSGCLQRHNVYGRYIFGLNVQFDPSGE